MANLTIKLFKCDLGGNEMITKDTALDWVRYLQKK